MTEQGEYADTAYDDEYDEPPRRRRGLGAAGCLASLVALALVVGLGYVGLTRGVDWVQSHLSGAADYAGPGTGRVVIQVKSGDSGAQIGNTLKAAGVVESVEAFTNAFADNADASSVQVGFYSLRKEMKASDAVAVLVNPANLIQSQVTIPEGSRLGQIVSAIVKRTDFTERQLTRLLAKPETLGLPAEAGGNPEGYLFPATYTVTPGMTPKQLLTQMVAKTRQVERSLGIAAKGRALGLTPHQVITVASILEYEASRDQDYPKVARAIYNRLDDDMRLQLDSTVAYVSRREGDVWTTDAERNSDSAYNTYQVTGLPPGPIGSPGEKTIEAALNPTPGPWLYWVVVNLRTGATEFNTTYAGHQESVDTFRAYCRTSDAC